MFTTRDPDGDYPSSTAIQMNGYPSGRPRACTSCLYRRVMRSLSIILANSSTLLVYVYFVCLLGCSLLCL